MTLRKSCEAQKFFVECFWRKTSESVTREVKTYCFSKTDAIKDCICKWKCRANLCDKKHHTLLQDDTLQQASIKNTFIQQIQKVDSTTFLQVIPMKISNDSKTLEVHALLRFKLAHQLQLKGEMKRLNMPHVISKSVTVKSKLVTFSISSRHHPEHLQVHNTWVVDTLNLPPKKYQNKKYKVHGPTSAKYHLVNKDIYLLNIFLHF